MTFDRNNYTELFEQTFVDSIKHKEFDYQISELVNASFQKKKMKVFVNCCM